MGFSKRRLIYLVLFIILMALVALMGSVRVREDFLDNAFVVEMNPILKVTEDSQPSGGDSPMDTWKKCNIFTCKNKDAVNDYDKWLEMQRQKLADYKQTRDKLAAKMPLRSSSHKTQECPPRISMDDWEEPVLTEEEEETLNKLDEVEGQIAEAEARLQEVNKEIADQQAEFASNAASMQQMMNDMENSAKNQKDMKFYENAVDMQVKPWQKLIEETKGKVEAYDKVFKEISKQLQDLTDRVNLIPVPVPKKKKKKK